MRIKALEEWSHELTELLAFAYAVIAKPAPALRILVTHRQQRHESRRQILWTRLSYYRGSRHENQPSANHRCMYRLCNTPSRASIRASSREVFVRGNLGRENK